MRALTILGQAYGLVGRPAEGIPLLKEAIALQEQAGAFVDRALWTRVLARLYFRAGDLDNAEATANAALRFAERHAERGNEAWIHWVVGEVLCERGDYAAAEQRFQSARLLAAELQMRPLTAHCHFSFGKLHKRTGRHQQAKEQLSAATARYREMDMRFWLEQAEAELARLA